MISHEFLRCARFLLIFLFASTMHFVHFVCRVFCHSVDCCCSKKIYLPFLRRIYRASRCIGKQTTQSIRLIMKLLLFRYSSFLQLPSCIVHHLIVGVYVKYLWLVLLQNISPLRVYSIQYK